MGNIYENLSLLNVSGAKDLAISNYEKAQGLSPFNPLIPYNIARVYFADNQINEAKNQIYKSLELKPDFQSALDLLEQIELSES